MKRHIITIDDVLVKSIRKNIAASYSGKENKRLDVVVFVNTKEVVYYVYEDDNCECITANLEEAVAKYNEIGG